MLLISRDAEITIAKHAWHVYPLDAFGYLLGKKEDVHFDNIQVYGALPCSKTAQWNAYNDRWNRIDEHLKIACCVGDMFGLNVVGVYATTGTSDRDTYPVPESMFSQEMEWMILYHAICCRSCSSISLWQHGRWLWFGEDSSAAVCREKHISNNITQKRIMKQWLEIYGAVDYSNEYVEGMHRKQ